MDDQRENNKKGKNYRKTLVKTSGYWQWLASDESKAIQMFALRLDLTSWNHAGSVDQAEFPLKSIFIPLTANSKQKIPNFDDTGKT